MLRRHGNCLQAFKLASNAPCVSNLMLGIHSMSEKHGNGWRRILADLYAALGLLGLAGYLLAAMAF